MKYVIINQYGIGLKAGAKNSKYIYTPKSEGTQSYIDCETWIRRHDSANTCAIVEREEGEEGEK